jgi:multicomponent Na+:H+ antiporter subunit F
MMTILAMGLIALRVIATGQAVFLEIAIALGLVAFLATVFFARLIETRGHELREGSDAPAGESNDAPAATSSRET